MLLKKGVIAPLLRKKGAISPFLPKNTMTIFLELLIGSVFFGRYWLVFLGIYHTDIEGKLGRYFQCRRYKKRRIYSK